MSKWNKTGLVVFIMAWKYFPGEPNDALSQIIIAAIVYAGFLLFIWTPEKKAED